MLEAISVLFGAVFTVAVCTGLGRLLLGALRLRFRRVEEYLFSFVAGSACLSLIVFGLASIHLARRGVFLLFGAAVLATAILRGAHRPTGEPLPPLPRYWKPLFGALFGLFAYLYFFTAMAPEISPDGSSYHLGLVSRYLHARGFYHITTNMYAYLSQGTEMLFLYAFAFGRHSAAALVHFAFLVTLPFAMLTYARRFGFPVAGALAALLVFLSPVVGYDGSAAYLDVAVACVLFVFFYLLRIWDEERTPALLIPIGLLAGFAYAMKYTAVLALPYALGFIGWKLFRKRQKLVRPLASVAACALLMIVPWAAKNWITLRNPVSPFFNKYFPNPYVHITFEQEYRASLAHWNGVTDYRDIPLGATVRGGQLQGVLGPVFLLVPLALLALRRREGRHLLLAACIFGLTYPANIGTRFLIPCLPFLALAMGLAVENWRAVAPTLVLFHALTSWPSFLKLYCDPYNMRLDKIPVRAALRLVSEKDFLNARLWGYPAARMVEETVPPESRVLCNSAPPEAYTSRDILVGYEGAFNQNLSDLLSAPLIHEWQPTRQLTFRFVPRSIRRLRVLQTASGSPESWSVNELRVFHGDAELPREPQWRLTARPNPWEVQMAFDGNPLTRWRSWQPLFSGMYLEVDLGRLENVDRVVIDATPDQPNVRLSLDGQSRSDLPWERLAGEPQEAQAPLLANARRLATSEIKWQGIEYVLINKSDFMAEDIRKDPKDWGLTLVGEKNDSWLYRIE
jgi:hypothetical protein